MYFQRGFGGWAEVGQRESSMYGLTAFSALGHTSSRRLESSAVIGGGVAPLRAIKDALLPPF